MIYNVIGMTFLVLVLIFIMFMVYNKENDVEMYSIEVQLLAVRNKLIDTKTPLYEGSTTYTMNKNSIYMCMKDKNDEYFDIETLTYVYIHELAHVITNSYSGTVKSPHDQKFIDNFDMLLNKADQLGIHYKIADSSYCESCCDK